MTKYRKNGETDWKSMPETTNLTETITGLDENSFYEITVAARYVGGHWGPPTDPLRVKTESLTTGKCCFCVLKVLQESRATAWTTARCPCKFRYVCYWILQRHRAVSTTAWLSCIGLHQQPFKCCNYTQYADFRSRDAKSHQIWLRDQKWAPGTICTLRTHIRQNSRWRRPPYWKWHFGHNPVSIASIGTEFYTEAENGIPEPDLPSLFIYCYNPRWRRPPFWNQLNGDNSANSELSRTKFDTQTENEVPEMLAIVT